MLKRDEIETPESCFNKAQDNERLFVMLARDPAAPVAIRAWIAERIRLGKNVSDDAQIREARECANLMESERPELESSWRQQQIRWTEDTNAVRRATGLVEISLASTRFSPLTRTTVTWEQLKVMLEVHRVATCVVETCLGSSCPCKDGVCWSPTVFGGNGLPSRGNAEGTAFLVLDVDRQTDEALLAMQGLLVRYQHLLHATHADRPGSRCLRVVVRLSRTVPSTEWPAFWSAAVQRLEIPVDAGCADVSRFYYLPSRPRGADYFMKSHEGEIFDVDAVMRGAA